MVCSLADTILSVFDRIFIINLAHRADRRREMQLELGRIGLSLDHPAVTLFPASAPAEPGEFESKGARGCFESHLAIHREIVAQGIGRALLLEDDASFAADFTPRLSRMAGDLHRADWDMFYSVVPLNHEPGDTGLGPDLLRLAPDHVFSLAHFIGFSGRFSQRAVPYLEAMQGRKGGDPLGGPMHIDGAYCWMREAHPDLTVLGSRVPLALQRASRSDIAATPVWDRVPGLREVAGVARRSPRLLAMMHSLRRAMGRS